MRDRSDFFVGYRVTPRSLARLLQAAVLGSLFIVSLLSALLAIAQRDPGPGRWEDSPVTLEGTLTASPYPVLNTGSPVLLAGQGKRGLGQRVADMEGRVVRVRGLALERDGLRLLEVVDEEDAITLVDVNTPALSKHAGGSPVRLRGEIIDPKCFCGAMKPGDGKTHKACAALCLRGGMPPVLATRDAVGVVRYYVLTDPAGGRLAGDDLMRISRFAGDRVEVRGVTEERDGMQTLRVNASEIWRL
jgi:hypothetical protein